MGALGEQRALAPIVVKKTHATRAGKRGCVDTTRDRRAAGNAKEVGWLIFLTKHPVEKERGHVETGLRQKGKGEGRFSSGAGEGGNWRNLAVGGPTGAQELRVG